MSEIRIYNEMNGTWLDGHPEEFVIHHFRAKELACKHCGEIRMMPGFKLHLLKLRLEYNESMTVLSCCRCDVHNKAEGGHPKSAHLCDVETEHTIKAPDYGCCGIDIDDPTEELLVLAWNQGWSVGIRYKKDFLSMMHIDRIADYSHTKPHQRRFFYPGVTEKQKDEMRSLLLYGQNKDSGAGNTGSHAQSE